MTRQSKYLIFVALVIALPLIGYWLSYGLAVSFPMGDQHMAGQIFLVLAITIGLLVVPYWMLKLTERAARQVNPRERELRLRDIPKDKDQLNSSRV